MAEFTFGQVEAVLAELNSIASDKRVAFGGRLKQLQKQGLKAARATPGKGRAAMHTFSELMQMALGVELLQFGVAPQRAALLVSQNWDALAYSVFLATFTEDELLADREDVGAKRPPINWIWLVRADALADLTVSGVSEYDTYDAITALEPAKLRSLITAWSHIDDPIGRRSMMINGSRLARNVIGVVVDQFKLVEVSDIREELVEQNEKRWDKTMAFVLFLWDWRRSTAPEKAEELSKILAEFRETPRDKRKANRYWEMLNQISPEALDLLERLVAYKGDHAADVFKKTEADVKAVVELHKLAAFLGQIKTDVGKRNVNSET